MKIGIVLKVINKIGKDEYTSTQKKKNGKFDINNIGKFVKFTVRP